MSYVQKQLSICDYMEFNKEENSDMSERDKKRDEKEERIKNLTPLAIKIHLVCCECMKV